MHTVLQSLVLALLMMFAVSAHSATRPSTASGTTTAATSGFDINKVPVVNPQLGKFPYVGLIEGYQPSKSDLNKDVPFDRYEFFDGAKIISLEGRLATIEAKGQGAAAHEVFKTYESLVTGLGGVKVYEGDVRRPMKALKLEFGDKRRHRSPTHPGDQMGVYMLRTPGKEIWFEAYVSSLTYHKGKYFLTVMETKALDTRASLLSAEQMKKELDAQGHVALYVNFDFDKTAIKPDSQPTIDEVVKLLKNNPSLSLTVEGHTDNVARRITTSDYPKAAPSRWLLH
jgi:OOP family OmpA-OmpF porin